VAAGIPVITMDSDAAGSRRLYFIGTNNLEAGRLGGKRVVEQLGARAMWSSSPWAASPIRMSA